MQQFPRSNAVDNTYSWLAIGWTCAGQPAKAREIDEQITRLFPLTSHAGYAETRFKYPQVCGAMSGLFDWDYEAMRWRERNRIDTIQARIKTRAEAHAETADDTQPTSADAVGQSTLEASPAATSTLTSIQAVGIISNIFEAHMLPKSEAFLKLKQYYAGSVNYYGKQSTPDEVMEDKSRYFNQWPARDYEIDYGALKVDCDDGEECRITGKYDWSLINLDLQKKETGRSTFEYTISTRSPYKVILERSEVNRE